MTPHLPVDTTHDRIAELHAVAAAARARPADDATRDDASPGAVDRLRDAVGLRLIRLGAAVASDGQRLRRLARP
jgi:hypothetical protein